MPTKLHVIAHESIVTPQCNCLCSGEGFSTFALDHEIRMDESRQTLAFFAVCPLKSGT